MSKPLTALYKELDFLNGALYTASDTPLKEVSPLEWVEKGEWLAAAKRAGAEKIFFIENNPVVVFAECDSAPEEKIKAFNRIWSLARPRLLFLASPTEITVLDLAQEPILGNKPNEKNRSLKSLATLQDISKIAIELQAFHRNNVESGKVFGEELFGDLKHRADQALIHDIKAVRFELLAAGLPVKYAHALIGRSIFIRYLEDRGILTKEYFLSVAKNNAEWSALLSKEYVGLGVDLSEQEVYYPRVLSSKSFSYALFKQLAHDFNGDMFPDIQEEEQAITEKQLELIQGLLYGEVGRQKKLFFFSYRFDIIPLDLISSIYEEFYHLALSPENKKNNARQDGAYYTPPVLVEFLLARILDPETLEKSPRILDPACGSGIFLVEAFRRIVRYDWHKKNKRLDLSELKSILKNQIAGIEINGEAARITAFSLYLATLHYLDPPSIMGQIKSGQKLPNLLVSNTVSPNHFNCIWAEKNAFNSQEITENQPLLEKFCSGTTDIVIGNPPWGAPGNKADKKTKARENTMLDWCKSNSRPIGDKEPSQAFIWRAFDFAKVGGKVALLVSAGVLFKHGTTTQEFREKWLDSVHLNEVFNFSHVRKFFFNGAVSPFVGITFTKQALCKENENVTYYWSAKQVNTLTKTQAVVFSKYDVHLLKNEDLSSNISWKTYWFGRSEDLTLIKLLLSKKSLSEFIEHAGRGYEIASKTENASVLAKYNALDIRSFSRYDAISFTSPPERVYRFGNTALYSGKRILVKRGISENSEPKGQITARYEEDDFCFRNAIHGIKLLDDQEWQYKVLLGILWSSLTRYFFFMVSSNWGLWHHEIHLKDELLKLPVVLDNTHPATSKIIAIVDSLRNSKTAENSLLDRLADNYLEMQIKRNQWEEELDQAVFQLYGLNNEHQDLIRDFCEITLPYLYQPFTSEGIAPVTERDNESSLKEYIQLFSRRWNAYLNEDEEMRATIHIGADNNLVALEFFPSEKGDSWDFTPHYNTWGDVLKEMGKSLHNPLGNSQIVLEGIVHAVTDDAIIIIKRNEKRFWTNSLAREDADATLCKRMLADNIRSKIEV
ncbi:MAG: SAM-dependent DNA methyltransferase [Candidatus Sericytochromatia bacterium]|nr:SAM-dependent DNA methyltransferase [Candidatus Sericytochromatia bacterium]